MIDVAAKASKSNVYFYKLCINLGSPFLLYHGMLRDDWIKQRDSEFLNSWSAQVAKNVSLLPLMFFPFASLQIIGSKNQLISEVFL